MSGTPKRRISPSVVVDVKDKARLIDKYCHLNFSLRKKNFTPSEKNMVSRYYKRIFGGKTTTGKEIYPLASLGKIFVTYRKAKGFNAALATYAGDVAGVPRLKGQWIDSAGEGTRVRFVKGQLIIEGKHVEKRIILIDREKLARAIASDDPDAVKKYFKNLCKGVPEAAYLSVKNGQNQMGALPKQEALVDAVNLIYAYDNPDANNYHGHWFKGFEVIRPINQRLPSVNEMANAIDKYRDDKAGEKIKQYEVRFKSRSKAEKKNRKNASDVEKLKAQIKKLKKKKT